MAAPKKKKIPPQEAGRKPPKKRVRQGADQAQAYKQDSSVMKSPRGGRRTPPKK